MRNAIGVVTGIVVWLAFTLVAGMIMRETWPAYDSVADAMTFTLPMMIARLVIGAVATVAMGLVTARITSSRVARLLPGILLLLAFIPQHVMLWDRFPPWYHFTFLLTLVPLTHLGNALASMLDRPRSLQAAS